MVSGFQIALPSINKSDLLSLHGQYSRVFTSSRDSGVVCLVLGKATHSLDLGVIISMWSYTVYLRAKGLIHANFGNISTGASTIDSKFCGTV